MLFRKHAPPELPVIQPQDGPMPDALPGDGTADEFYQSVLDAMREGVYVVDRGRNITYWSRGAERITGFAPNEVLGRSCRDGILMHCDASGQTLCGEECLISAALNDGKPREASMFLRHKEGHRIPVFVRARPRLEQDGSVSGAVEIFDDLSVHDLRDIPGAQNSPWRDRLTGVASHELVAAQLEASVRVFTLTGAGAGVLMISIDHLGAITQKYGAGAASLALRMTAHALAACTRQGDLLGRWGEDRFLAILTTDKKHDVLLAGERLRSLAAASSFTWWGDELRLLVSIGGTLLQPLDLPEVVLQRAGQAMLSSFEAGGNRVTVDE